MHFRPGLGRRPAARGPVSGGGWSRARICGAPSYRGRGAPAGSARGRGARPCHPRAAGERGKAALATSPRQARASHPDPRSGRGLPALPRSPRRPLLVQFRFGSRPCPFSFPPSGKGSPVSGFLPVLCSTVSVFAPEPPLRRPPSPASRTGRRCGCARAARRPPAVRLRPAQLPVPPGCASGREAVALGPAGPPTRAWGPAPTLEAARGPLPDALLAPSSPFSSWPLGERPSPCGNAPRLADLAAQTPAASGRPGLGSQQEAGGWTSRLWSPTLFVLLPLALNS